MLKLEFFILFVFAGLCFGNESDVENGSSGQENKKNEVKSAGTAANDNGGDGKGDSETDGNGEEQTSTGGAPNSQKGAGLVLPNFIGDDDTKKRYVDDLVQQCGNISVWKINDRNVTISLPKCTYICEDKTNSSVTKVQRIPKGKVCGPNNVKCGDEGDCPLNLPSC
uniref:Putative conserved secreted protein n=1 Tax=Ixodes ricinus TaxID=34613 RepID=A0A6B0UXT8_IXORI